MTKTNTLRTLLATVLLPLALEAAAQTMSPMGGMPMIGPQNIAQLSASGTVEAGQDLLTMTLSTTREGGDAAAVQAQLKQALDAALAEARKSARPGQLDVRTGNFSLYPRQGRDGKLSGWQGQTEMVLEGRDIALISAVAGRIGTLTLSNVGFGLSREQRSRSEAEAQALAIEQFKARAAEVTKSFGFTSYTLREVSVHAGGFSPGPRPRMLAMETRAAMAPESPIPVEAGRASVMVTVSGSIQMK